MSCEIISRSDFVPKKPNQNLSDIEIAEIARRAAMEDIEAEQQLADLFLTRDVWGVFVSDASDLSTAVVRKKDDSPD